MTVKSSLTGSIKLQSGKNTFEVPVQSQNITKSFQHVFLKVRFLRIFHRKSDIFSALEKYKTLTLQKMYQIFGGDF